ncbi:unnamed protein product [Adineta ricciae]|uniref:Uncharacterized protein n=1 Tax=Adineta ricciae TaxID=249248 RepID=A0A813Y323_ADIRI|nr:unnamed protein product [Adineta ricciae]
MKTLTLCLLLCILMTLIVHQTAARFGTQKAMSDPNSFRRPDDDEGQDESRVEVPVGNVRRKGQTRANVRRPAKKQPCGRINFDGSDFATGDVKVDVGNFGIINGLINGC